MLKASVFLLAIWPATTNLYAQDPATKKPHFSEAEESFLSIYDELVSAESTYFAELDRSKKNSSKGQYLALQKKEYYQPIRDRLLGLEESHRGSTVGLMVLHHLIRLGSNVPSGSDDATTAGRREALTRLPHYCSHELFPTVLLASINGFPEREVEGFLRRVIESRTPSTDTRLFAQFALAKWILSQRDSIELVTLALSDKPLENPLDPDGETDRLRKWLSAIDAERLPLLQDEAIALLERIVESDSVVREPSIVKKDSHGRILQLDRTNVNENPTLNRMAEASLFRERHLRVGKPAPDFTIDLVDGTTWSLRDNIGRVVIIQFSFKGCGPCEAMYPVLHQLLEQHEDSLTILSVMADPEITTTRSAAEKLSWNVAWDGVRGPVATKWAVDHFPTIYVVGQDGIVAAVELRGESLERCIDKLVDPPNS